MLKIDYFLSYHAKTQTHTNTHTYRKNILVSTCNRDETTLKKLMNKITQAGQH